MTNQPYFSFFKNQPGVIHIVTTRSAGVSKGQCSSLNLGFRPNDKPKAVRENRARVCRMINADPVSITAGEQVHGSSVAVIHAGDKGSGALDPSTRIPATDAMITDLTNIPLLILIADCAAVGLYDPVNKAIGIAHAGWRGTAAGIASDTIAEMKKAFGSNPADMLAAISPSIGRCCYEVGGEVLSSFRETFGEPAEHFFTLNKEDKVHLDLWQANLSQLINMGLKRDNIEVAGMCTACHTALFYSHRAEGANTGRFGSVIMMR
ncbi:MAG: peptidoglycan editing factor PgeF [Gammaproteobacteria bacterium]|nr:peptidoglycan editing factor PgeF [Gammaproteobacteria bacterium]